jgi:DNA-binding transcriptional ArsR family regulator
VEGLRLPEVVAEKKVELTTVRARRARQFIPPVPMEWFRRACLLPGKALVVALVAWYRSKVERSPTVILTQTGLSELGVSRQAKYRALRRLEEAGLVTVRRRGHKSPEVTVIAPAGPAGR